jgi:MoaA/NifB/PqqE/SkfB family radical SAM enzyme
MCFYANDMAAEGKDLSFEEIKKLSETAGSFKRLWLSGGEPTMRDDLPEIVEMIYQNNHITDCNFPTNGIKKDRLVEWIKRLRQSCPDMNISVSISFDGFGQTHDTQRGIPCFYKVAETLKALNDNFRGDGHVIVNIATVITKYNIEEVVEFVSWVYGRFNVTAHTIEAARGNTREQGVKILTEKRLREIQDTIAPFYLRYAKRIGEGMSFIGRGLTELFYVGLMRSTYNIRAANLEKPSSWKMDCTAGETTLVIDYDGRFRSCELREPIGKIQDYDCDVQKIMQSEAMKKEIETIGHGYKANCWCTHGCWIMSSMTFNPGKMVSLMFKANSETKKLARKNPVNVDEAMLEALENKYNIDREKLAEIGIIPASSVTVELKSA